MKNCCKIYCLTLFTLFSLLIFGCKNQEQPESSGASQERQQNESEASLVEGTTQPTPTVQECNYNCSYGKDGNEDCQKQIYKKCLGKKPYLECLDKEIKNCDTKMRQCFAKCDPNACSLIPSVNRCESNGYQRSDDDILQECEEIMREKARGNNPQITQEEALLCKFECLNNTLELDPCLTTTTTQTSSSTTFSTGSSAPSTSSSRTSTFSTNSSSSSRTTALPSVMSSSTYRLTTTSSTKRN